MLSSYFKNNYMEIVESFIYILKPSKIAEYGILHGYTTLKILETINKSNINCKVVACDIFDDFKYNSANYDALTKMFKGHDNLTIKNENFYNYDKNTINDVDLLFIDVGNTKKTYEFFVNEILNDMKHGSYAILEGGSVERDKYYIDRGYSQDSIYEYLCSLPKEINRITIDKFPSVTIMRKVN